MRISRVFLRYALLQLPGMFFAAVVLSMLVSWGQISQKLGLALFGLWVLKDAVMYPLTRIAYQPEGGRGGAKAMLGASGVVEEEIAPGATGLVRIGPELWRARAAGELRLGRGIAVRVTDIDGLVLRVEQA